jgi:uncharacterized hydrophobic protein (TIGR00271 family)
VRLVTDADVARMREGLFFEQPDIKRKLSRFWLLLTLAAVIASAGVVGDSTATVIGAMIVAPLMIPILGTVLAVVLADRLNLLRSLGMIVAGAAAVIAIAYLIGLLVEIPVTAATNGQVAARVTPRLIDLFAALATGAVGSVALAREDISDTLPGVAIAISLVPPLAVVGLTLEAGLPGEAFGAFLLFATNVSAILVSGLVVMSVYRVHHRAAVTPAGVKKVVHRKRSAAVIVAALVVIAVPLALTTAVANRVYEIENQIESVTANWADEAGWEVVSLTTQRDTTVVRVTGPLPEPDTKPLQRELESVDLGGTSVKVELIPSQIIEVGSG